MVPGASCNYGAPVNFLCYDYRLFHLWGARMLSVFPRCCALVLFCALCVESARAFPWTFSGAASSHYEDSNFITNYTGDGTVVVTGEWDSGESNVKVIFRAQVKTSTTNKSTGTTSMFFSGLRSILHTSSVSTPGSNGFDSGVETFVAPGEYYLWYNFGSGGKVYTGSIVRVAGGYNGKLKVRKSNYDLVYRFFDESGRLRYTQKVGAGETPEISFAADGNYYWQAWLDGYAVDTEGNLVYTGEGSLMADSGRIGQENMTKMKGGSGSGLQEVEVSAYGGTYEAVGGVYAEGGQSVVVNKKYYMGVSSTSSAATNVDVQRAANTVAGAVAGAETAIVGAIRSSSGGGADMSLTNAKLDEIKAAIVAKVFETGDVTVDMSATNERLDDIAARLPPAEGDVGAITSAAEAQVASAKGVVVSAFGAAWADAVPSVSTSAQTVPGGANDWPTLTIPVLGEITLSPDRAPWIYTYLHAMREVILWVLVIGFVRYGARIIAEHSMQVATVPQVQTTQTVAELIPAAGQLVAWAKGAVTVGGIVTAVVVAYGAGVGVLNSHLVSWSNVSSLLSASAAFASAVDGTKWWPFVQEMFPLGAFLTLLVGEAALYFFISPIMLGAAVVVRAIRA